MTIGFIGLGVMGHPMAMNMAKAGYPLLVWNRSTEKYPEFLAEGVEIAQSIDQVFQRADPVILMLANEQVIDLALSRGQAGFAQKVRERTIVNMGTTSPGFSKALSDDIVSAGGRFVEAPVSGSRKPAEAGQLVSMVAGRDDDVESIREIIKPMCRSSFACGAVPNALLMKLSVNHFLITMVAGLAEAAHFARRQGVDMKQFQAVLDAGPMASSVSSMKLPKLVNEEYSVQASITDVLMNNQLIVDAARGARLSTPLLDVCLSLFTQSQELGHGRSDMAAVVRAIEHRTDAGS